MSRARLSAWIYGTTTEALGIAERHTTGIPFPGERGLDPEHDLIERIHASGAKQLVSARDAEAARISDLATEVPVAALLARAQQRVTPSGSPSTRATPTRRTCAATSSGQSPSGSTLRSAAAVRALDRDNVGRLIALDDTDGTCDVLFVNDRGSLGDPHDGME